MNWENLMLSLSTASRGTPPVVNSKIKKELLKGSKTQKADYLYDWAVFYLSDKKYQEAEVCLLEITKLGCWEEDEILKPGTYSLLASCYFNTAIKNKTGRTYTPSQFEKAQKYAKASCKCILSNEDLEKRTKTGAWQVLFCIAVLTKDLMTACKLKAKHNLFFLSYRKVNPFEPDNNWYVCNEIGEQLIEDEFLKLLKQTLNQDPDFFDPLFELHVKNKAAFNYTESLAFAATFVEDNIARTAILYHDLFEYINLKNTDYENYFFNLCEKLSAVLFSGDSSEIRRTLKELDSLKNEHKESYDKINDALKQNYTALRLYSLNQLYEYDETIRYAGTLAQNEYNEQVLYCIANAREQLGEFEHAERAAVAALSIEADAFKIQGLGRLYYARQEYGNAYAMFKWAIEGVENDIGKGEKTEGPKYLPSIGRSSIKVLSELYPEIIDTLLMLNDFNEAKRMYHKYKELPNATEKNTILLKIDRMQQLYEAKEKADTVNDEIKLELLHKDKTIQNMVELQKNWYGELVRCQLLDTAAEVTDEIWESLNINDEMQKIIDKIEGLVEVYGSSRYEDELRKVNSRYPGLSDQSKKYLASAEQIFQVFIKNPLIDCAPALVEFARVYEESLWHYIDHSDSYRKAAQEQLRNRHKTLGTAGYIVRNYAGPLRKYGKDIKKITDMRNESAHAYISKEPEIAALRKMIWSDQPTLLDLLSAV